jgi:1-acyl-sn-glycerol-3-phosphate acyltransferase
MKCLAEGQSLIIFPEGTRTRPGEPLKFHRGPSNIALSARKAITPITIRCEPATLMKNQHWYKIPAEPSHYTFKACATIDTSVYMANGQLQSAAARQLTRDLVNFFSAQTGQILQKQAN